jgi:hypothetical protein
MKFPTAIVALLLTSSTLADDLFSHSDLQRNVTKEWGAATPQLTNGTAERSYLDTFTSGQTAPEGYRQATCIQCGDIVFSKELDVRAPLEIPVLDDRDHSR